MGDGMWCCDVSRRGRRVTGNGLRTAVVGTARQTPTLDWANICPPATKHWAADRPALLARVGEHPPTERFLL